MAVTKVITIKADTKGAVKSFDTLGDTIQEQKQITIEFEEELADLERQLKETGKASFSLGRADTKKRVGELKDAIKDQRLGLKKLNLERSNVGALNKNIKQQAKLKETYFESSAGLVDINRLTSEYALKLTAAKNLVRESIVAVKAFAVAQRAAFIATGVGILLVALAAVVTFWDDIAEAVTDVNKNLQKNVDLSVKLVKDLKLQLGFNEQILKSLDLQGDSQDDQLKVRKDLIKATQLELIAQNVLLNTQLQKEQSKSKELTLLEKIDRLSRGITVFAGKATKEELERQQEIADQINSNQTS